MLESRLIETSLANVVLSSTSLGLLFTFFFPPPPPFCLFYIFLLSFIFLFLFPFLLPSFIANFFFFFHSFFTLVASFISFFLIFFFLFFSLSFFSSFPSFSSAYLPSSPPVLFLLIPFSSFFIHPSFPLCFSSKATGSDGRGIDPCADAG